MQATIARLREQGRTLKEILGKLGDAPESKTARMNIELTHSLITDIVTALDTKGGDAIGSGPSAFGPQEAMLLAKAIDHLGKAEKSNADTIRKAHEEAAEAARSVVKKSGIGNAAQHQKLVEEVDKILLGVG